MTSATTTFQNKFEGCGTCDESQRVAYAEQVLMKYGGSSGGIPLTCGTGNLNAQASNGAWSGYKASNAIAYAESHWNDGVGECAAFTSASVEAGGVNMSISWVPTMVTFLSGVAYEEYSPSHRSIHADAGDIVVYSNATGGNFCIPSDNVDQNCGHVGLVVTGGTASSATADFHNNAHHHLALEYILSGSVVSPSSAAYSTFRVYHVAALATATCGG